MALINTTTTGVLGTTIFGDGSGDLTIQQNGVTVNKITSSGLLNGAGGGPAFSAYPSAGVSAASSTWVKIPFNTEDFDTNSNYDSTTNYRFTPTVAGYYQVNYLITMPSMGNSHYIASALYRNGVVFKIGMIIAAATNITCTTHNSLILYLNGSTDFIEVYGFQGTGSTQTIAVASNATGASTIQVSNHFNATMIRSA